LIPLSPSILPGFVDVDVFGDGGRAKMEVHSDRSTVSARCPSLPRQSGPSYRRNLSARCLWRQRIGDHFRHSGNIGRRACRHDRGCAKHECRHDGCQGDDDFEALTGDYYTPLKTRIAAGQPPDVYYAHTSNMAYQNFATGGTALQIDDMIAKNKVDLSQWFPQGIAALKLGGKLYGLPVRGQVAWLFMYYNADLLKKHGIAPPTADWSLDDLVNAGKQLTTKNGANVDVWGLGPSTFGYEGTCGHVRRWNGEYWNPASGPGTTCTLDSDACVASMEWSWNLMFKDKIMAPTSVTPEKLFGQSKLAISIERLAGERATYAQNTNKQFAWGMQVMPKGPTGRRGGFLSTDTLQISKATKSPDPAFQLLQWFTNKDSGIAAALQSTGSLTPGFRPDVYCSPELLNDADQLRQCQRERELYLSGELPHQRDQRHHGAVREGHMVRHAGTNDELHEAVRRRHQCDDEAACAVGKRRGRDRRCGLALTPTPAPDDTALPIHL